MAADDPLRNLYGHPLLPAGYNSAPHAGDEIDGAGYNEPVWPTLFDSFIALDLVMITQEALDFFAEGCPDLVVAHVEDTVMIKRGPREFTLPPQPGTIRPTAGSTVIKLKDGSNTVNIRGTG